jgi:hypothetical protein
VVRNGEHCDSSGASTSRRNVLLTLSAAVGGAVLGPPSGRVSAKGTDDRIEARSLALTHERRSVQYANAFEDPVVVAKPVSYGGGEPCFARLGDVSSDGFDAAVQEWSYLDGGHIEETVGSLVVEAGVSRPSGGPRIEAGTVDAGTKWTRTTFDGRFSSPPVVLAQPHTNDGSQPVVSRIKDVSRKGMSVQLQSEEDGTVDATETVGFVAIERTSGTLGGRRFEAGVVPEVGHEMHTIEFADEYEDPTFLADVQTFEGGDAAALRYRNLREGDVEVFVEEETSHDEELWHAPETVGYVVLEGAGDEGNGNGRGPDRGERGPGNGEGHGMGRYGQIRFGQ